MEQAKNNASFHINESKNTEKSQIRFFFRYTLTQPNQPKQFKNKKKKKNKITEPQDK